MLAQAVPAADVILLQGGLFPCKFRQMLRKPRLEHEGHGIVQLARFQIGMGRLFKGLIVRAMRDHHVVQADPAGGKAVWLGIILAINIAHQFRHDVLVIPWRAKGVFHRHPAFAKQDKVDIRRALHPAWRGQHGKDRRIGMIEQDRTDGAIVAQIIFAGRVIAMPCHHIQGRVVDERLMELALPFDHHAARGIAVLKGCDGRLEIAAVGHAIGPNRPTPRQGKLLAVILAHKTARGAIHHLDPVNQPTRDNGDFTRLQINHPKFRAKSQAPLLRDDQKLTVGGIEILIHHRGRDQINMAGHAHLRVNITRRRHRAHARQPRQRLRPMRDRVPAVLPKRGHIGHHIGRRFPIGQVKALKSPDMFDRWLDTIAPCALILMAWRGKGSAGKLLAIKPIGAFLRAVAPARQGTGQGLGFKIIAKAGHIAGGNARGQLCLGQVCHAPPLCGLALCDFCLTMSLQMKRCQENHCKCNDDGANLGKDPMQDTARP